MKDVEDAAQEDGWDTPHDGEFELESACQKYDAIVKGGRVSSAVKMVTNRDLGGLYRPTDACSKTGRPVIDILREKHPEGVIPDVSHFDTYSKRTTTEFQTSMHV